MTFYIIMLIVWLHFVADFFLQSEKMALNKSKKIKYLLQHCFVYSLPFLVFGLTFSIMTFCLHFLIDFITSKCTNYFWNKEQVHWFFVVIGFDQAIHYTLLFLTYLLLK